MDKKEPTVQEIGRRVRNLRLINRESPVVDPPKVTRGFPESLSIIELMLIMILVSAIWFTAGILIGAGMMERMQETKGEIEKEAVDENMR